MIFRRGQKVVCINDAWNYDQNTGLLLEVDRSSVLPVLHGIYTIKIITDRSFGFYEPMKYRMWRDNAIVFDKESFRPLVSRKTDISVFTQLLVPTKILERA